MSGFPDELALYIQSQIGIATSETFSGRVPEVPDDVVVVVPTIGMAPDYTHENPRAAHENPRAQIVCRSKDYDIAWERSIASFNTCMDITNSYLGETFYMWVNPLQSPFLIDFDTEARFWIGFNVEAKKVPS